jgi:hypothetical protein
MEDRDAIGRMMSAVAVQCAVLRETSAGRTEPPFIGIRLSDGSCPDDTLYDSREDCVRHLVSHDPYIFPLKIGPEPMGAKEAWCVLFYARKAKARGVVFHHEDIQMPQRLEDLRRVGIVVPTLTWRT